MADLSDPTFWIPTFISVIAVVLFYVDMRRRQKQDRSASKAMLSLIKTMRKQLELMRQQIGAGSMTSQQILLQKREQDEWNRLKDVAKAIGWVWDRISEEE